MAPEAHCRVNGGSANAAMEMHQIRYFLAVCETLNFTRAAEQCHVTQPALTRAIQKLEEEFGGLLFRRERHLTHMTDLGRLIRPQLEQIWQQTADAKTTARSFLKLENAPLNLGVMCTIGPLRSIGFVTDFWRANQGVELTLREGVPAALSELLRVGELDLAVMAQPEPFEERFDVHPLYRERFVVAFPPGHRFASQNGVRMADIEGESYLLRINCEYKDCLRSMREERGVGLQHVYRSEREDWIQTMVMAGIGIAFLPEYSVVLPGLQTRPLVEPEVVREVALVTVAGRRFSPAVTTFVRAIRAYQWPA
jgi:LysR family transcriptional regulator, hydrogen peroxide-inducible genes activator